MKIVFRLVFAAALIALGIWLWTIFFPSPEKAIRKQLSKLAEDVSFLQNQNGLSKIADAESVSSFFTTNVEVIIKVPGYEQHGFSGRAEITQAALASRQAVGALSVKFPDMTVAVAPDKQSATVDVTVEVRVNSGDAMVQEMKFSFMKSEGKWLIQKAETVQPVSILNLELRGAHFIMAG